MNYTNAHTPQWADAEQTLITLQVDFDGIGEVSFVASPTDTMPHGREVFARASAGEFGVIAPFIPVIPSTEETLASYGKHLDDYLDSVAASLTFTNGRYALASRAGYPNPWQSLAIAFGTWMDNEVNLVAWQIQQEILAGTRPLPTWEEFLAMLPEFSFA